MSMLFADLRDEVSRRGTKSQSGSEYTSAIKVAINNSLFRIAREAPWRCLRRTTKFNTITSYTTGTGGATTTLGSTAVTITGATLLTDKVQVNRKIKLQNSGKFFRIATITGETTLTLDQPFDGASGGSQTYEILPQEEYALPPQVSHRMFMWHEMYGYPFKMTFMTDQDFFNTGLYLTIKYIPTHYRMWGENDAINQPLQPSAISISSSSTADTSIPITIFGTVSGYPDSETINTNSSNGTTVVTGSKVFSNVERVVKAATSVGRITAADGASNTIAVMPTGDTTAGIMYSKVQLYPLPTLAGPMNVWYYKDPYRFVNDNDVHEMGQEFDEAIILLATSKIKAEADIAEGDKFYALYREELISLKKTNVDKPDFFATLRRPGAGRSNDAWVTPSIQFKQFGVGFGPQGRY
jgi:hypothetical protein